MAEEGETRILICMDGSKYCDYAFEWYLQNIKKPKDYVILYHSVEFHTLTTMPMGVGAADLLTTMIQEEKVHAERYLEQLTQRMKDAGLHGKVKQTTGPPRTEILHVAEEEKVEMIVMGTRGMGKLHGKVKQTTGPPRTEITRVAEEENVNMIIMGTRGMGKVKRTFMGSVSDHVLHHAHVPVIICRHKDDHHHHHHSTHAQSEVKV